MGILTARISTVAAHAGWRASLLALRWSKTNVRCHCCAGAQGFEAQGNEFSYYMLIASAFVLNGVDAARQWTVFPWAHSSCNQPSDADQLRPVRLAAQ